MYLTEQLESKWSPVLDHDGLSQIKDPYKRAVTAIVLENQERAMAEESRQLNESAPTNFSGGMGSGNATLVHTIQSSFHSFVVLYPTSLPMISAVFSQ